MHSNVYSPGWGAPVAIGAGQAHIAAQLAGSIRHPSRQWHDAPTLRAFGRSSSTAHRAIHRLAALGVIAIQTRLGAAGGVRFTFGVRRWRHGPARRGMVARMLAGPNVSRETLLRAEDDGPEDHDPPPRRPPPVPYAQRPAPTYKPTPDGRQPTFAELMARYGYGARIARPEEAEESTDE
jgi:hypothetical protein